MIQVTVMLKATHEPLKRLPVMLRLDADESTTGPVLTDRAGVARFEMGPVSGKVLVDGVERYRGRLDGDILVELWSTTQRDETSAGAPTGIGGGSIAYPSMSTRTLTVDGREILTDSEGYLVQPGDWSESFVRAQAAREELSLTDEHWQLIRFLRDFYAQHGVQASVRNMVRHFREIWGPEKGTSSYLHRIFPNGGPQKQGNRLAGLLRTKGEH